MPTRQSRSLRDSVVVVTGASSGIGRAAAIAFAEEGAHVVLAARRADALEAAAEECRRRGIEALAVPTDTADPEDVERLARLTVERFGGFDVWVNNASALVLGSLEQTPPEAYRRAVDVNFFGYVHGSRAALEHFRVRRSGVLINNASMFAVIPTGYTNAYTASKQAVAGLTDALRQELVTDRDIHVVKILPAGVDTPILQHAANFTGRRVRPLYPLISAERVARAMVRSAQRPRRAALVGGVGRLQTTLYRMTPAAHEWISGRAATIALRKADQLPRTSGNLFQPVAGGTSTDGRLRAPRRRLLRAVSGLRHR